MLFVGFFVFVLDIAPNPRVWPGIDLLLFGLWVFNDLNLGPVDLELGFKI